MYAISGITSTVAGAFIAQLPKEQYWAAVNRPRDLPLDADHYLILNGLLYSKAAADQSATEKDASWDANYGDIVKACHLIFSANDRARVVVLGSESAYRGSFDETYAQSKLALHNFVEREPIGPNQQLVAISPSIIGDSRMTGRRSDSDRLLARMHANPKGRFVTAAEVASVALFLLSERARFITGTVIRMHGGQR